MTKFVKHGDSGRGGFGESNFGSNQLVTRYLKIATMKTYRLSHLGAIRQHILEAMLKNRFR
jgi:hypothetical protein